MMWLSMTSAWNTRSLELLCEMNGWVMLVLLKRMAEIDLRNVETTVVEMYGPSHVLLQS